MRIKVRLLSVVLALLLVSCGERKSAGQQESVPEKLVFSSVGEGTDLNYELSFVELETSDSCLIGKIGQIEYKGDTLFILDYVNYNVLAFNSKGAFLGMIGKKGNEPGELVSPQSIALNLGETELYLIDSGRRKLITYDAATLGFVDEWDLPCETSCVCSLGNDSCWVWNDRGYQSLDKDFHFLLTDRNLRNERHLVEKDFKSGYICGPFVSLFSMDGTVYGYVPFSSLIYKFSADGVIPFYDVEYKGFEFPTVSYMDKISNHGSKSYFGGLSESGYISYNMIMGVEDYLFSCFMAKEVKYIGIYNLSNKKSSVYALDAFSDLLSCGQLDYVALSTRPNNIVFPLNPYTLKELEKEGYDFDDDLKKILPKISADDNPILCVLKIKS